MCRDYSRAYLQCRMDSGLMAHEDLHSLGFDPKHPVVPAPEGQQGRPVEIIAGMSTAAAKGKAGLFGMGLPGTGGRH